MDSKLLERNFIVLQEVLRQMFAYCYYTYKGDEVLKGFLREAQGPLDDIAEHYWRSQKEEIKH